MDDSNKRKSDFLGMSYGKANQILRKRILFRLVQETGKDVCYRCGTRIDNIEDLSIEHKRDWLHVSSDLFWDLDNIAFSHIHRCNRPRKQLLGIHLIGKPNVRRLKVTNGYAWCSTCKQEKLISEFSVNNSKKYRKLQNDCKSCRKSRYRARGV